MAGLTAAKLRLDKKCGKSGVAANKKCGKNTTQRALITLGAGAVAVGSAVLLFKRFPFKPKDLQDFAKAKPINIGSVTAEVTQTRTYRVSKTIGESVDDLPVIGKGMDGAVRISEDGNHVFKQLKRPRETRREVQYHLKAQVAGVAVPRISAYDPERGLIKMEALRGYTELGADAGFASVSARKKAGMNLVDNVAKLHRAGFMHNDIKPDNIMVNAAGDVRLVDFTRATPIAGRKAYDKWSEMNDVLVFASRAELFNETTMRVAKDYLYDNREQPLSKLYPNLLKVLDTGLRQDALRLDKKCGKSGIANNKKCSKKSSPSTITKVALGAGAVAGVAGLALLARRRWGRRDPNWKGFSAPGEDWDRIEAEARKGGKKWDVFEDNKKANAVACAATKVDAWIREDVFVPSPRCFNGRDVGSFGNYVVHPSGKYGIKYLHNQGEAPDAAFRNMGLSLMEEGEILKLANDVGVPSPKLYKASEKALVMEHMGRYKRVADYDWGSGSGVDYTAPAKVKLNMLNVFSTLHTNGIAHNDINGNNLLYNPRSQDLKLIDFGLAEIVDNAGSGQKLFSEMMSAPGNVGLTQKASIKFKKSWLQRLAIMNSSMQNEEFDTVPAITQLYYKELAILLVKDDKLYRKNNPLWD